MPENIKVQSGVAEADEKESQSKTSLPKKPKARMELGNVTHHNIQQMKRLNQVIFPVNYNDKFYADVQEAGELTKLAYYNDIVVGAVCCRTETAEDNKCKLYIMTLGCLPAYRRLGLGRMMLEHVFRLCSLNKNIESVYLHVQVNNETALDFYKKFGFKVKQLAKDYYKRIEPADAYVLEKNLHEPIDDNDHHQTFDELKNDDPNTIILNSSQTTSISAVLNGT